MILVIDNYDSFTYNLVQYLGELGQKLEVWRNDQFTLEEVERLSPRRIVISPGPGTPREAGRSVEVIRHFAGRVPILGVCLGHQCIGAAFGGEIVRAGRLMHGKTSLVHHDGKGIFTGLPSPFEATRYHSLVIQRDTLPDCLQITAETDLGEVMAVRHRAYRIEGVQFHPEAILTQHGKELLWNFLAEPEYGPPLPSPSGEGVKEAPGGSPPSVGGVKEAQVSLPLPPPSMGGGKGAQSGTSRPSPALGGAGGSRTTPPAPGSPLLAEAIRKATTGVDLTRAEAAAVMHAIMTGEATPSQIAGLITALKMKGERVDEITGFTETMRQHAIRVRPQRTDLVDTCGTGGDGSGTFNISTTAAFVAAGAGLGVAKHGGRSVSSRCGSADVLEALGVNLQMTPDRVAQTIDEVGVGFLFAQAFHPAMKSVASVRREISIRTIFNILGPLTNPAGAQSQLLGVYHPALTDILAHVLASLGTKRAFVVHGHGSLDEIATTGETMVSEVRGSDVHTYRLDPAALGFRSPHPSELAGAATVQGNAEILLRVLEGEQGARRDVVVLNAAAALGAGGKAPDLKTGVAMAQESIDSGAARGKLEALRRMSQG